jgi:hypothetical protein
MSWDGGKADPLVLTELRATAYAYRVIADASFEGIEEAYENPTD